jgi:hypothetical protein
MLSGMNGYVGVVVEDLFTVDPSADWPVHVGRVQLAVLAPLGAVTDNAPFTQPAHLIDEGP